MAFMYKKGVDSMLDNKMLISIGGIIMLVPAMPILVFALIGIIGVLAGFYYIFSE